MYTHMYIFTNLQFKHSKHTLNIQNHMNVMYLIFLTRGVNYLMSSASLVPAPIFCYAHATRRTDRLIFRASVLRPSRCVHKKYGAGDEASPQLIYLIATVVHKIAMK